MGTYQALCEVHEALSTLELMMAGDCRDLLSISQESKDLSSSHQDGTGRWDVWLQTIGLRESP